ncbi:hypothetical protein QR680_009127 [Steinernema hermaphroditum]|uniref:Ground-like domain-containing protein n=1 Tax=Steinernema hermaphroditum TaxID=289476 RepID=A0AA39IKJ8_9BILA|nr:hypothetical protein QR680_009127 [Steinernema hermaphroditum]
MHSSAILLLAFGLVAPSLACFGGSGGGSCCPPATASCAPSVPRCSASSYGVGAGGAYADASSYPRPLGYQAPPAQVYPQQPLPQQPYIAQGPPVPAVVAPVVVAPVREAPYVAVPAPNVVVPPPAPVTPVQVVKTPVAPVQVVETHVETHQPEPVAPVAPEQPPPPPEVPITDNHVETNVAPSETYDDVEEHKEATPVTEEHHEVTEKHEEAPQTDYAEETNAETPVAGDANCNDEELRAIVKAALESQMDNLEAARKIEGDSAAKFGGRFNSIVSDNEFAYVNWYGKRNCQLRVNNRHSLTWED